MSFLERLDDALEDWVFRIAGVVVLLIGTSLCAVFLILFAALVYWGVASL